MLGVIFMFDDKYILQHFVCKFTNKCTAVVCVRVIIINGVTQIYNPAIHTLITCVSFFIQFE